MRLTVPFAFLQSWHRFSGVILGLSLAGCCLMRSTSAAIVWKCSQEGLAPELLRDLSLAIDAYVHETGDDSVAVTSGRRTLRHQAELMAAFTQEQLMGMYGRNGTPGYVQAIGELRERQGRSPTAEEVYRILCEREDGYISSHLYGGAIDIASASVADVPALRAQLAKRGFRTLDERSLGIACIHATHAGVAKAIVRE